MENVCVKIREVVEVGYSKEEELEMFISEVFTAVVDTFRFTNEEKEDFLGNKVAQLIAAIPFVAGCEDAKRTALAHLAIYITELRGGAIIFDHCEVDNNSVYTRLRLISSFKGGNEKVIHHGMSILALIMLEGYRDSTQKDRLNGIYNPLNEGAWDYNILLANLKNDIEEHPCIALDMLVFNEKELIRRHW